jgi:hypothetical protein
MKNLCKCMFATAALLFSVSAVAMETSNCAPVEDMITSPQFEEAGTSRAFAAKRKLRKRKGSHVKGSVFRKLPKTSQIYFSEN